MTRPVNLRLWDLLESTGYGTMIAGTIGLVGTLGAWAIVGQWTFALLVMLGGTGGVIGGGVAVVLCARVVRRRYWRKQVAAVKRDGTGWTISDA